MEYQKIINLLDNTSNQPSKFTPMNWIEINDGDVEHIIEIVKSDLKLPC